MIIRVKKYDGLKFPKHTIREYKCPVVIWNVKGKALFYEYRNKQKNISKK
jgi:hypothetical protein